MVINGSFYGHNKQIPLWDSPRRPMDQILSFTFGPKCPNLAPKFGPKSLKWQVLLFD